MKLFKKIKNHLENKALHRELKKRKEELAKANYRCIKLKLMQFFFDLEYQTSGLLLNARQLNILADDTISQSVKEGRLNDMYEVVQC